MLLRAWLRRHPMIEKVLAWMNGRKTYCTAAAIIACGVLRGAGVEIPEYVWAALAAMGLAWLRAGVKKAE